MCDITGPLKLCTCNSEIDKSKPYWVLKTICLTSSLDIRSKIIGTLSSDIDSERILVERLNNENLFDFDYNPQENDTLQIIFSNIHRFSFKFNSGKWSVIYPFGVREALVHFEETIGIVELDEK